MVWASHGASLRLRITMKMFWNGLGGVVRRLGSVLRRLGNVVEAARTRVEDVLDIVCFETLFLKDVLSEISIFGAPKTLQNHLKPCHGVSWERPGQLWASHGAFLRFKALIKTSWNGLGSVLRRLRASRDVWGALSKLLGHLSKACWMSFAPKN